MTSNEYFIAENSEENLEENPSVALLSPACLDLVFKIFERLIKLMCINQRDIVTNLRMLPNLAVTNLLS